MSDGEVHRESYGFFQFLRISCFLGFGWIAKTELENGRAFTGIASIGFAILFNPILKITMDKSDWSGMDAFTCLFLIVWLIVLGIMALVKRRKNSLKSNL